MKIPCDNRLVINEITIETKVSDDHSYYCFEAILNGHIASICPTSNSIFKQVNFKCMCLDTNLLEAQRKLVQSFFDKNFYDVNFEISGYIPKSEVHNKITSYRINLSAPFKSLFEDLLNQKGDFTLISGYLD